MTPLERAARRLVATLPMALGPKGRDHLGPSWQATAIALDELSDALNDLDRARTLARYCEHGDDATTDAGFVLGE